MANDFQMLSADNDFSSEITHSIRLYKFLKHGVRSHDCCVEIKGLPTSDWRCLIFAEYCCLTDGELEVTGVHFEGHTLPYLLL